MRSPERSREVLSAGATTPTTRTSSKPLQHLTTSSTTLSSSQSKRTFCAMKSTEAFLTPFMAAIISSSSAAHDAQSIFSSCISRLPEMAALLTSAEFLQ